MFLFAALVCGVIRGQNDAGPSVESTSSGGIVLRVVKGQDVQVGG